MIWFNKYKPKSFDEFKSHQNIIDILKCYDLENIPNLIIYGQQGHNKSTITKCLINHLYGKYPELIQKQVDIKINSKDLSIGYFESEEMVEISPSNYGTRDRQVIQSIVKEMAQSRPIMGLFGKKERKIRIIVITGAENLTRDAQAALRRTMEMYTDHFRIIMVCTEISKLIEPIRSRCLFIRVPGFLDNEITNICKSISEKENFCLNNQEIEEIAKGVNGNCKRAIFIMEMYCFNKESEDFKKKKVDLQNFLLEWEMPATKVLDLMKSGKVENIVKIRKDLFGIIGSGIPPTDILLFLVKNLLQKNFLKNIELVDLALKYDERMLLGMKPIFHLEAFVIESMCALLKK